MASYSFINRQQQLNLALVQLKTAAVIAVDTESSGFYTYESELCLLQVRSGDYQYLIDTQANLDLGELGVVFADEKSLKIFHGASADVAILQKALDWKVRNVFDTLPACRMLRHESCSLANLVKHYVGIVLEKKEQKSNWKKRPLTKSQLDYANSDTEHLENLMELMVEEIGDEALLDELREECKLIVSTAQTGDRKYDTNSWIRVNGAADLDPKSRGRLRALHALREERARKDNIAPFRIVSSEGLIRIAGANPKTAQELRDLRAANPSFLKKDGARAVDLMQAAEPIEDNDMPEAKHPTESVLARMTMLKRWRRSVAEYRRMDESMIANNRILGKLAEKPPMDIASLTAMQIFTERKIHYYGAGILATLQEKSEVQFPDDMPRMRKRNTPSRATEVS